MYACVATCLPCLNSLPLPLPPPLTCRLPAPSPRRLCLIRLAGGAIPSPQTVCRAGVLAFARRRVYAGGRGEGGGEDGFIKRTRCKQDAVEGKRPRDGFIMTGERPDAGRGAATRKRLGLWSVRERGVEGRTHAMMRWCQRGRRQDGPTTKSECVRYSGGTGEETVIKRSQGTMRSAVMVVAVARLLPQEI